MGVRAVIASLSGSWITLDVRGEGGKRVIGEYHVRPPDVRTALTVIATLPGALSGEAREQAHYLGVVKEWLPKEVFRGWFELGIPFLEASRYASKALSSGYERKEDYESDLEKVEDIVEKTSWHAVLAEYRNFFGSDPLLETWAYFLQQHAQIRRVRAVGQYAWIEAYLACKPSEKDPHGGINNISARAYPEMTAARNHTDVPDVSEEFMNEQIALIEARKQQGEA